MLRLLRTRAGGLALLALAASSAPLAGEAAQFSPPVNISRSRGGSHLASLVVDARGTPRVFWHDFTGEGNLSWAASHDGTAWTTGAPCAANVTRSWSPRAAADARGGVHVAWRDRTQGNDEIYYARFDGSAWSEPVNVSRTLDPSGNPVLALDSLGHPHVAWEEGPDGAKRFWEAWACGASWSPARDTGLPFRQAAALDTLRLAFAPDDTLHALWHDGATSMTEIFHAELPPGAWAWSPAENVSESPFEVSAEPAPAFARDGTLHVAFVEQDPVLTGAFEICHVALSPAGAWGPKNDVSRQGTWCHRPGIAVGADALPRVAWHADTRAGKEVFLAPWPGEPPINVSRSEGSDSSRPALALDSADAPWLAWTEGPASSGEIFGCTASPRPFGPASSRKGAEFSRP